MDTAEYLRVLARAHARTSSQRWADAAALWERVVEHNPVHGGHWERLAEARHHAGDHHGALAAYQKVLALGAWSRAEPTLPGEVAYRIACCHARLGETEQALAALGRALERGYRDLDATRTEPDLEPLRDDARFRELVGWVDVEALDRDGGWRADLRLLSREVRRRAYRPSAPWEDFDAAAGEVERAVPRLTDTQLLVEIMKLLRPLGDGHAYVEPAEDDERARLALPLHFFDFEEGMFVTAAEPAHEGLLGAQVVAVDGRPCAEVLAALDPLIARDNDYWPRRIAPTRMRQTPLLHALGLVADPAKATLTVRLPDGRTEEVAVPAVPPTAAPSALPCPAGWLSFPDTRPGPLPLYLRNCGVYYWFDHRPGSRLVYFQFNGVGDAPEEPLERFSARLFDVVELPEVDRLVVDLRWNGGGNTFLDLPLLHRIVGCGKLRRRGALCVIVGRATFSAAQNLATFLDRHTEAVFVGEPTGSRPNFVGETAPFRLPYSGLEVNVSDLFWQTSWPMDHRAAIAPDLYTPPTFEAYRANRDPAMEAILALDTAEHLPGW